ncbi:hypothetical protein LRS06_15980 [Hymenobacter sp. J193]|uniref:hypothetical protein n=1 Tax=Hymenobacter sp. J193 TaxID=2898429 RepID=UPI0021517145|nr:hypothetical protein [Hymenobacter sp. J193]MCR5889236.1 hypothetical protein [Hymenobacter sp. J193]
MALLLFVSEIVSCIKKAGFQLICEEVSATKPFNNKQEGLKSGIWFKVSILGRLKSAIQYDSGQVRKVLTFWPNGLPRKAIKYKPNGKPVLGSSIYYPKAGK